MRTKVIDVVFDGPPSHESGRFVEVETPYGKGLSTEADRVAQWIHRADGYWVLRIEAVIHESNEDFNRLWPLFNT